MSLGLLVRGLGRARRVRARERWSRDQLAAWQQARVRELVGRVANRSAFYRTHWGGVPGPDVTIEQLRPVARAELMHQFDAAVTDPRLRRAAIDEHLSQLAGDPMLFGEYRVMASSGSTGEPGRFVYSRRGWDAFLDGLLRWTSWMGVRPRIPRLPIAAIGAPDARHMTFRGAASIDVGLFRALRLSATQPIPELVAALQRHQPVALNAYPSVLALLAAEQEAGRLAISPRVLCTSSEQRTTEVTARITRAFGVTPFDCYATTETGVTALDCERHEGLHLFEDLCLVEIVEGRVLMTNLFNDALPMIRVEISDLLEVDPRPCPCGRTFRRLRSIEGRADDILSLPALDGTVRRVHPLRLRSKLGAVAGVLQYRVTWRADLVHVEVVRDGVTDPTAAIQAALVAFCAEERVLAPRCEVTTVGALARERSAKLQVVRQV